MINGIGVPVFGVCKGLYLNWYEKDIKKWFCLKFVHVDGTLSLNSDNTVLIIIFCYEFRKDVKTTQIVFKLCDI